MPCNDGLFSTLVDEQALVLHHLPGFLFKPWGPASTSQFKLPSTLAGLRFLPPLVYRGKWQIVKITNRNKDPESRIRSPENDRDSHDNQEFNKLVTLSTHPSWCAQCDNRAAKIQEFQIHPLSQEKFGCGETFNYFYLKAKDSSS